MPKPFTMTQQVFNPILFADALLTKRKVKMRIGVRELAKIVGVSPATISRCENFKEPDINTFFNLCQWLELPPTVFFQIKQ